LPHLHRHTKHGRRQPFFERPAQRFFKHRPFDFFIDQLAANVNEVAVFHTTGAGALAIAAGQATVQVLLGFARGLGTF
jgi:hypothetical protein